MKKLPRRKFLATLAGSTLLPFVGDTDSDAEIVTPDREIQLPTSAETRAYSEFSESKHVLKRTISSCTTILLASNGEAVSYMPANTVIRISCMELRGTFIIKAIEHFPNIAQADIVPYEVFHG